MLKLALVAVLSSAVYLHNVYAAPADGAIVVRGNKMYNAKTGQRFIMKGVCMQVCKNCAYLMLFTCSLRMNMQSVMNFMRSTQRMPSLQAYKVSTTIHFVCIILTLKNHIKTL